VLHDFSRALPLGLHEQREFFVQRGHGLQVFSQFECQPSRGLGAPPRGKLLQRFFISPEQAAVVPERGLLLCPKAEQTMVGGHRYNAIPEQGAKMLRQRKVVKGLAMDQSLPCSDLQAHPPEQAPPGIRRQLEFGDALGQVLAG